jgi:MFS family permease
MRIIADVQARGRRTAQWLRQPASVQQRNVRNVVIDGIGVGIVQGVASFLSVFLVRLDASSLLVALLTALPAVTGMLLVLPIGRLLDRQRTILPWYSRARVTVFACYALIGILPFFVPQHALPSVIIGIWALATIPQTIVTVAFTVVMSAVAGPDQRASLMSRRWGVLGATTALTVAVVGVVLDQIPFPLSYQVVFIGSFGGALLSFAFSRRITLPDQTPSDAAGQVRRAWGAQLRAGIATLVRHAAYTRFLVSQFVFNVGLLMAVPLFPLYWVRELHVSDAWVGTITLANQGVVLIAYFLWAALVRRTSAVVVLRLCSFGLVLYPVLTGLTRSVPPLVLYAAMAGVFGAGLNLVLFDVLLRTCPPEQTASYVGLYQWTIFLATLVAPLVGTSIADRWGYAPALFLAGGLRGAGALLFTLLQVGVLGAAATQVPRFRFPIARHRKT